jgi:glycogen debranching enzyme
MSGEFRILEGSTFCICNLVGDLRTDVEGLFADDTRFLSHFRLTLNGEAPLLLSSGRIEYFSAAFFMRNPLVDGLNPDELSIRRERFVGEGMQDRIVVENQSMRRLEFTLELEVGTDFADILSVKDHDFALGNPMHAAPLPMRKAARYDGERTQFLIEDDGELPLKTQIVLSRGGEIADSAVQYRIALDPRGRWELHVDVFPVPDGELLTPRFAERRFGEEVGRVRDSLAAWQLRIPQLRASWGDLEQSFRQAVADLASLRMRSNGPGSGIGKLPGAGVPWFMTVFGRDTIITCLQTLIFGPELARTALEVLAELQATKDDPSIDAEPGKIVHEVRHGKAARTFFERYYGTADATPLYLILLSEVFRWTDDVAVVRNFKEPALRALEWIDNWGDLDGDGFVEYERRAAKGAVNQSWKDSEDSQRFHDGSLAEPPIAPCEIQGYVYDAKLRVAELAREVWRDRELASRLEREAEDLRRRFDEAFWVDDRGGFYALALDRDKKRVDSLCSNIGHLLWSGIVPDHRVEQIVDALMGDGLWSGWGVRTMSTDDAGYNPLSYHNGTVWPHDNSLIALGLARYGRWPEAQRIIQRMITASARFGYQLPEVFAGMRRSETPFPVAYPTAARPQAWAAGTPVLLLQVLLGLQPDRERHSLVTRAPEALPSWAGSVRLSGVRAFEGAWDVRLEDGRVRVEGA